ANIDWSQKLAEAGANVYFGLADFKVHAKICLVGRKEGKSLRYYATLATGNFNENTANIYCDHNLFTVNQDIVDDLKRLFEGLVNNKFNDNYKSIITSPLETRPRLLHFIDREIKHANEGIPAYMMLKMNSLTDEEI